MAKTRRHAQLSVNGGAGIGFRNLKSGQLRRQTASRPAQPNVIYRFIGCGRDWVHNFQIKQDTNTHLEEQSTIVYSKSM